MGPGELDWRIGRCSRAAGMCLPKAIREMEKMPRSCESGYPGYRINWHPCINNVANFCYNCTFGGWRLDFDVQAVARYQKAPNYELWIVSRSSCGTIR